MKNISRIASFNRFADQMNVINAVENKKKLSVEEIEALKSVKKSKTIGLVVSLVIILIYLVTSFYGYNYTDYKLPKNTEEVQCHTDSNGVMHTSHPSLRGMTLEDVGMDDENYKFGTTFYVYVDIDTQIPVLSLTKEKAEDIHSTAMWIIVGSHLFLIISVILLVIYMQVVGNKWNKYVRKYNLNDMSYQELKKL